MEYVGSLAATVDTVNTGGIESGEATTDAVPFALPSSPSSPSTPLSPSTTVHPHPRLLLLPLRAIRTSSLNPRGSLDDLATGLEGLTASLSSPGTAQPRAGQEPHRTGDVGQVDQVDQADQVGQTVQMVQFPAVMQISQNLVQDHSQEHSYELIFGHRRLLAARQAGWSEMWCVVYPPLSPLQVHDMRLRENMHREPLHPLAEAAALQVLYLLENAHALDLHEQVRAQKGDE